jgi:hypothetical protein
VHPGSDARPRNQQSAQRLHRFQTRRIDEGNYFRNQYGVHVLEDGLLTPSELMRYIILTGLAATALSAPG